MIYTVTLNPALDVIVYADEIQLNKINKMTKNYKFPGGKAINVSRTLHNLNIPSIATGFLGGYPGRVIEDWFNKRNMDSYFIPVEEDNRVNIKIKSGKNETTFNGVSPYIPPSAINDLIYYLSRVREGDIIVMGGSIPDSVPADIYERIINICIANKASFVIDIPALPTLDALKFKPLLIKPNVDDLAKMFGKESFNDEDEIIKYGLETIDMGAQNAIVSLGAQGSYLFTSKKEVFKSPGIKGKVINTFSSRDAMIGAFIGYYMKKLDPIESFKMAAASASATAFVEDIAEKDFIYEIFEKTKIRKIK